MDCYGRQVQNDCANEHSRDVEFSDAVAERETAIWADLTQVAQYLTELDALTYKHAHDWTVPGYRPFHFPANYQGTAALTALRDGNTAEFGRLAHAGLTKYIKEIAADQVRDERGGP